MNDHCENARRWLTHESAANRLTFEMIHLSEHESTYSSQSHSFHICEHSRIRFISEGEEVLSDLTTSEKAETTFQQPQIHVPALFGQRLKTGEVSEAA